MRNLNTRAEPDLKSLRDNVAEAVATLKDSNASDSRKRTAAKLVLANQGLVSPQAIKLANFFQAYEANPYTSSSTDSKVPAKNSWMDAYKERFKYWLGIKEIVGLVAFIFYIYLAVRIVFSAAFLARILFFIECLSFSGRSSDEVANMLSNAINYLSSSWDFDCVDLLEPFNKVMPGTLKEIDPITQDYSREVDEDNFKKAEIKLEVEKYKDKINKIEVLEAKINSPEFVGMRPLYVDSEFNKVLIEDKAAYIEKLMEYRKALGPIISDMRDTMKYADILGWIGLPINAIIKSMPEGTLEMGLFTVFLGLLLLSFYHWSDFYSAFKWCFKLLIEIPTSAVDTVLNGLFIKTGLIKVVGAVIDTLGLPKFFNWLHKFEYFSVDKSIDVDGVTVTDLNDNYSWWNQKEKRVLTHQEFLAKATEGGKTISPEDQIILDHLMNKDKFAENIEKYKDKIDQIRNEMGKVREEQVRPDPSTNTDTPSPNKDENEATEPVSKGKEVLRPTQNSLQLNTVDTNDTSEPSTEADPDSDSSGTVTPLNSGAGSVTPTRAEPNTYGIVPGTFIEPPSQLRVSLTETIDRRGGFDPNNTPPASPDTLRRAATLLGAATDAPTHEPVTISPSTQAVAEPQPSSSNPEPLHVHTNAPSSHRSLKVISKFLKTE